MARYLLISLFEGATNSNRLYVADLGDPASPNVRAPVRAVVETDGAEYTPIGVERGTLFVRSDAGGAEPVRARARSRADDDRVAGRSSPSARHRLGAVVLAGGRLVAESLVDVQSRIEIFDLWTGAAPRAASRCRRRAW